jgi:hypothetical protein
MSNIGKDIVHIVDGYIHHHNSQLDIYSKVLLYQAHGN